MKVINNFFIVNFFYYYRAKQKFILIIISLLTMATKSYSQDALGSEFITHRPPTVAGIFYPEKAEELQKEIYKYLDTNERKNIPDEIIGMVAPHAGYIYSGWVAGKAYRELIGRTYDAIIILAPSHHKRFRGASIFNGDAYSTPLGLVNIDLELSIEIAKQHPLINLSLNGHDWKDSLNEHSIEVQLPFLQVVLPGVPIVPISIGTQDDSTISAVSHSLIEAVKNTGKKVLIIASTDLSHYHNFEQARKLDLQFVNSFKRYDYFKLKVELDSNNIEACGGAPVVIAMIASEHLGATMSLPVFYATSANSPYARASKDRVVGYFSGLMIKGPYDFFEIELPLDDMIKQDIINRARQGLELAAKNLESMPVQYIPTKLNVELAAFVTLKKDGKLRGCMGHTYPKDVLPIEIERAAFLAASRDFRFDKVTESELDSIKVEVTILSRFKRIFDPKDIIIGKHGVYIRNGNRSGLFLPNVATEQNWDLEELLVNLCKKANLATDMLKHPDTELYIFNAIKISEE